MRILIAIGVPRREEAGAAGVVINHVRELAKRKHSVDCWFLEDVIGKPVRPRRLESLIFAARVARRILDNPEKYDVVNLHAPWGCVYGFRRRLFRPPGAPPYVLTMQGSEERYAEMMKRERRKGRAAHFAWYNRIWHRLYHQTMYHWSLRTADYGAIANREGTVRAEIFCDTHDGRFCYVPNGVEERFFIDREYSEKSPIALLYVGTWLDRKGIYYLTDAFNILARRRSDVRLTVAGCISSEENVKEELFAKDVRSKITVLPFVARNEMSEIYARHDVFVFPSLVEGMPLTLLEAMASGLPVVTTNICGMADVVEDGLNGILVPPADAVSLASAVERLCQSPNLRARLGQQAQKTVCSYTWEGVVRRLEEVLAMAANRGARN